jgi:glycosyltransferase involved in cell wall biosynthesis
VESESRTRHVDHLNSAGLSAAVLHSRPNFECSWFDHTTRVVSTASTQLGVTDLLVVPELYAGLLPRLPGGLRHVVFNQNPHLTFQRYPSRAAHYYTSARDLVAVLTVSRHSTDLCRHVFPHLDVRRIRLGVDASAFHPADVTPGRQITYMPRRSRDDATLVLEMLKSRRALSGWQVQPLDGLSQAEMAAALRASAIFLHFTYQEGFGLPAAEAMACGNLVVGFHGFSGREFLLPDFSRPIPTGDVLAFANSLEDVLTQEATTPGWCRSRGIERERLDVVNFFRAALGRTESADPRRAGRSAISMPMGAQASQG